MPDRRVPTAYYSGNIVIADLIEALENIIEDFETYITECMDDPNRDSVLDAKATLARAKGEKP